MGEVISLAHYRAMKAMKDMTLKDLFNTTQVFETVTIQKFGDSKPPREIYFEFGPFVEPENQED